MLETDGLSQAQGGGAGIVLRAFDMPTNMQAMKLDFAVSNNEVEYEAVILD